jgi:hypothetical protein
VATAKGRWWVEHSYEELKDELGLDHNTLYRLLERPPSC